MAVCGTDHLVSVFAVTDVGDEGHSSETNTFEILQLEAHIPNAEEFLPAQNL
jgi:hypothetical protein